MMTYYSSILSNLRTFPVTRLIKRVLEMCKVNYYNY